jgi:hypothetical protein
MLIRVITSICQKVPQRLQIINTTWFCRDNIVCLHWVKLCYPFFIFTTMQNNFKHQKLILLSILLLVLLSYPFISIANKSTLIFGFPVLYLYIFIVWFITIVILFRLTDHNKKQNDE